MEILSKEEESLLAYCAREGDRDAFNRLVSSFQNAVLGHVLKMISWASIDDGRDIAQETWQEAWLKIRKSVENGGFDAEKGRFFTWLKNYIIDYKIRQWISAKKRCEISTDPEYIDEREEIELNRAPNRDFENIPDIRLERKEELLEQAERLKRIYLAYLELLKWLFLCGGYPHQQLAFAFSKLLYGHDSNRGTEGSPERLQVSYGSTRLVDLQNIFWQAYKKEMQIPQTAIRDAEKILSPLIERLSVTVEELTRLDHASRNHFESFLEKLVENTILEDYWAKHKNGFTSAVPDWCYKVKQRLQNIFELKKGADEKDFVRKIIFSDHEASFQCDRCKLRHIKPCSLQNKIRDLRKADTGAGATYKENPAHEKR